MNAGLPDYRYNGARAMVILHERHIRAFLETWRTFKGSGRELPSTDDPDYVSADALLKHVLGAARRYMLWACEVLDLPDPRIDPPPDVPTIDSLSGDYLEHVIQQWRTPLSAVPEERFESPEHPSSWKVLYCVDAMLEHAVMHPIRHRFQLEELMDSQEAKR